VTKYYWGFLAFPWAPRRFYVDSAHILMRFWRVLYLVEMLSILLLGLAQHNSWAAILKGCLCAHVLFTIAGISLSNALPVSRSVSRVRIWFNRFVSLWGVILLFTPMFNGLPLPFLMVIAPKAHFAMLQIIVRAESFILLVTHYVLWWYSTCGYTKMSFIARPPRYK